MTKEVNKEYESSVSYLIKGLNEEVHRKIHMLNLNMNSKEFNSSFNNIEDYLNTLYEKTRVLEDINKYTKEYITSKIHFNLDKSREILNSIIEDRNALKKDSYITYNVSFKQSLEESYDRDGTKISPCAVDNSLLTTSSTVVNSGKIVSIDKIRNPLAYKDNLDKFLDGEAYRSMYLLDNPLTNGLMEEISIRLDEATTVNHVDISVSNCDIRHIEYIYENDTSELIDEYFQNIKKTRKIKGVNISIHSPYYKKKTYQLDASRAKDDFWNTVREKEYATIIGSPNLEDIIVQDTLAEYKEDYKKYIDKTISWIAELKAHNAKIDALVAQYNSAYSAYTQAISNWNRITGNNASPDPKASTPSKVNMNKQSIIDTLKLDETVDIDTALKEQQKKAAEWLLIKDTADKFDVTLIAPEEYSPTPIGGRIVKK